MVVRSLRHICRYSGGVFLAALVVLFLVVPLETAGAQSYFSDATSESRINFTHTGLGVQDKFQGTGAAWFDFDRDGDLDLYVTRRVGANALYRNNGDGTFTNVAVLFGVADQGHDGAGVAVADYDNDGLLDIYLANSDGDVLFRNVDTAFVDVTEFAGVGDPFGSRGTSAAWGDFDADGWLDLYVTNHQHIAGDDGPEWDRLYRNNGDGTFEDVTRFIAEDLNGFGFIGAWTDFDDDGDVDLFLVNDCPIGPKPIQLLQNQGPDGSEWRFIDVAPLWNANRCEAGMGIAIGDYDRDGLLDYFYTNIGNPVLLRNLGTAFSNTELVAGIDIGQIESTQKRRWSWGANFLDYDLDGWLDLYVASGSLRATSDVNPQANVLFCNNQDGTFDDVTAASGAGDIDRTRTTVFADYDGDGDPDIFVVNYEEPARLYRNDNVNGNHYLIVELQGVWSNRDGIGSKVTLTMADSTALIREIHSGTSLGGGDDIAAYFGVGADAGAVGLTVRWPSGLTQVVNDVAVDQRIRIVESEPEPEPTPSLPTSIRLISTGPNPFRELATFTVETRSEERVLVEVFDVMGRRVETLFDGMVKPGVPRTVTFGGAGRSLGVYLFQARGETETVSARAVLVR